MDQILFVVFGHSVDNQIDAQVEGVFALFLAARRARVGPVAELVALPGATEIILAVDDRRGIADGNSFQVRIGDSYAADAPEQVITRSAAWPEGRRLNSLPGKILCISRRSALSKP